MKYSWLSSGRRMPIRSGRIGRQAFTLIEMLTVIAITAVLLTIIVVPVFLSFNMTRTASAFADAQDKARVLTERIAREISDSTGVRDMSGTDLFTVNGVQQSVPRHALAIVVPKVNTDGTAINSDTPPTVQVLVPYAKVDIMQPAQQPTYNAKGELVNPDTGKADPTMISPRGPVVLPAAPGTTMVRYWIGRRDPAQPYNDPYTGLLTLRNGLRDNLYVLFRAEVPLTKDYFWAGSNGLVMDDPFFFEPTMPFPDGKTTTTDASGASITKDGMVANWLKRATIQTEVSRYDMILPIYNKASRKVSNTNGVPQVLSLAQFRPERVSNDPATGATALRLGEETDNPTAVGSDVFSTQFGQWSNAIVRVWPNGFIAGDTNRGHYEVGRRDPLAGTSGHGPGFSIFGVDPSPDDDTLQGREMFDVTTYERVVSGGSSPLNPNALPFTAAVLDANNRSGWLDIARMREIFVPFDPLPGRGKVIASFSIDEVGNKLSGGTPNVPSQAAGAAIAATDPNDTTWTGAAYSGASAQVNTSFNRAYHENPTIQTMLHRFIDLRVLPNQDGTLPPLYPNYIAGSATGFTLFNGTTTNSRVKIVPGSEEVVGPDQLSGPHQGLAIRYTRVTQEPGPNQYRINYVDQPEPTDNTGAIDYSKRFPGYSNPPSTYNPTNFVSAVLQPQFRAGYIELNSAPDSPIPPGTFSITYRFQFTGGRDVNGLGDRVAVDYDSRQLLAVLLTIRNYPQASVPNPQAVTLKSTATVRNYLR